MPTNWKFIGGQPSAMRWPSAESPACCKPSGLISGETLLGLLPGALRGCRAEMTNWVQQRCQWFSDDLMQFDVVSATNSALNRNWDSWSESKCWKSVVPSAGAATCCCPPWSLTQSAAADFWKASAPGTSYSKLQKIRNKKWQKAAKQKKWLKISTHSWS